jgi:hypothetical protein
MGGFLFFFFFLLWFLVADCMCFVFVGVFRFEFATNEYINDMTIVTLETAATETGTKDFIAVGTTIDRGEDLAVKGAVRFFSFIYLRFKEGFSSL